MFPTGDNTYILSDQRPKFAEPDPADLRDGYNVIDKDGKVIGTFADIGDALPHVGAGGGVSIRRHPAGKVNKYSRIAPATPQTKPGVTYRPPEPPIVLE